MKVGDKVRVITTVDPPNPIRVISRAVKDQVGRPLYILESLEEDEDGGETVGVFYEFEVQSIKSEVAKQWLH